LLLCMFMLSHIGFGFFPMFFFFNFLKLHQCEHWLSDLTINGNMFLELCLVLHWFILCDLGGSIGCAKFE
jgi:hypothetical protein